MAQPCGGLALPREPLLPCGVASRHRRRGRSSARSPGSGWAQARFSASIATVAGDSTEDRTDHTPLGDPTERGMAAPILAIPSLQARRQQPENPLVMPLLTPDREPPRMLSTVKAWRNSALHEPLHALPVWRDLPQRRVTATPRTAPMGVRTARRFVGRLQHGADAVLEHFVRPSGEPQGA